MENSDKAFEKNIAKLQTLINQEENEIITFQSVKRLLIDILHEYKGNKLFGIFYKFNTILTTKDGDVDIKELTDNMARMLALEGYIVISGDTIYEKTGRRISEESTTMESVKKVIELGYEKDSLIRMSEFLASLTSHAIFILLNADSASSFEVAVFHDEEKEHPSELSIGMVFVEDFPEGTCRFLVKRETKGKLAYYACESSDFNRKCRSSEDRCFFTKNMGLSASHIQLFINNPYSKLIILDSHTNAPGILKEMINR